MNMKRVVWMLCALALFGILSACDDSANRGGEGQYCRNYCSPGCAEGAFCDNGACSPLKSCNPACDPATQYCDYRVGSCKGIEKEPSTQPPCDEGLVCSDGICEPETDGDQADLL